MRQIVSLNRKWAFSKEATAEQLLDLNAQLNKIALV